MLVWRSVLGVSDGVHWSRDCGSGSFHALEELVHLNGSVSYVASQLSVSYVGVSLSVSVAAVSVNNTMHSQELTWA